MVAGDLVNTASRIQGAAEPGTVFVGEATRRATEPTIAYADAGVFELKGKEGLTPLWRALRVVSGARGSLKSHGLEAPFVGRERELRQIKDLFHASAEEGQAAPRLGHRHRRDRQVAARVGVLQVLRRPSAADVLAPRSLPRLRRGRHLLGARGHGPDALPDRRGRASRRRRSASCARRSRSTCRSGGAAFVEPRLAQLLGLGDNEPRERQDLFAAWRLFFERLADVYPTVLAFEDMQWADESLLDFVEYLLEWSRNSPLYVVTLARPELLERRPTWGAGHRTSARSTSSRSRPRRWRSSCTGSFPGCRPSMREQILDRAEGVPLYAVETVRMLLDRGCSSRRGRSTARSARSARSRCPRRCTR